MLLDYNGWSLALEAPSAPGRVRNTAAPVLQLGDLRRRMHRAESLALMMGDAHGGCYREKARNARGRSTERLESTSGGD
jgi:hypothetical protein